MSFKHFKTELANSGTDYTMYTVPDGKEFLATKHRARFGEASYDSKIHIVGTDESGTYYDMDIAKTTPSSVTGYERIWSSIHTPSGKKVVLLFDSMSNYWHLFSTGSSIAYTSDAPQEPVDAHWMPVPAPGASLQTIEWSGGGASLQSTTFKYGSEGRTIQKTGAGSANDAVKILLSSGTAIKASSTGDGTVAEVMGIELASGTWQK